MRLKVFESDLQRVFPNLPCNNVTMLSHIHIETNMRCWRSDLHYFLHEQLWLLVTVPCVTIFDASLENKILVCLRNVYKISNTAYNMNRAFCSLDILKSFFILKKYLQWYYILEFNFKSFTTQTHGPRIRVCLTWILCLLLSLFFILCVPGL